MFSSKTSRPSMLFNLLTTLMVTGRTITSYMVFRTICVSISISRSGNAISPPKAIGKNMMESTVSPARVESTARREKCLPLCATFILLIVYALVNEPSKNASRLAKTIRGVSPNMKLKCSSPSQYGAAGSATANRPTAAKKMFMAKPVQITNVILRNPHTSAMQSLII